MSIRLLRLHPSTRTHAQGVKKFTILVNSSFVFISKPSVFLIYAQEWRRFLRKHCIFTTFTTILYYIFYGHTPTQEPNSCRLFLVHHYYILITLCSAPEVEMKILKKK